MSASMTQFCLQSRLQGKDIMPSTSVNQRVITHKLIQLWKNCDWAFLCPCLLVVGGKWQHVKSLYLWTKPNSVRNNRTNKYPQTAKNQRFYGPGFLSAAKCDKNVRKLSHHPSFHCARSRVIGGSIGREAIYKKMPNNLLGNIDPRILRPKNLIMRAKWLREVVGNFIRWYLDLSTILRRENPPVICRFPESIESLDRPRSRPARRAPPGAPGGPSPAPAAGRCPGHRAPNLPLRSLPFSPIF